MIHLLQISLKNLYFFYFVFFIPNFLGHSDNYIPANPCSTPSHIVPEWYFLPFYAILRSIPNKIGGVIGMFGSLIILLTIPFTNSSEIRSTAFRPIFKISYWLLVVAFFLLGWVGQMPVEYPYTEIGVISMIYYFAFFFLLRSCPASIETEPTFQQNVLRRNQLVRQLFLRLRPLQIFLPLDYT